MKIKAVTLSLLLAATIAFSSWLAINITKNMLEESRQTKNSSDSFMKNIEYVQIDSDGKVQNQLTAEQMIHYPTIDSYSFSYPFLLMQDKDNQAWYISAKHGSSAKNGEKILLWEDVTIKQKPGNSQPTENAATQSDQSSQPGKSSNVNASGIAGIGGMRIITSAATIYPKQKIAETDKSLVIFQGKNIVNATGAKIDFHSSTVKLLSQVKGKYAKNKKATSSSSRKLRKTK